MPYRISAPANRRSANRGAVLVEPPHFATGTLLREGWLGRPFLFGRRFLHASVGYSMTSFGDGVSITNRILDPAAEGVFIDGGVVLPGEDGRTDDEIVVEFARALRSDPIALAFMGSAARRYYLAGFSDSAEPVKRIVASGLAEGVFDLAVPITTEGENDPQASITAGKYSGKVITLNSEFEWSGGRALEDRGTTSNLIASSSCQAHRTCQICYVPASLPTGRRLPAGNLRSVPTSCKATNGSRKGMRRP